MSRIIKTSISASKDLYDNNGQWLPRGNYYFSINNIENGKVHGTLHERTFCAEYVFDYRIVIEMLSVAQARLARRANISHENMPSIASPTSSHEYPANIVIARPNAQPLPQPLAQPLAQPLPQPVERQLPALVRSRSAPELPQPTLCTICLDPINNSEKILRCTHRFHERCINRWTLRHNNCPVCRTPVNPVSNRRASRANRRAAERRLPVIRSMGVGRTAVRNRRREYNRHYSGSVARLIS